MAFVIPNYNICDHVHFYMRKDFADINCIESHWIERGDTNALLYYISTYMETRVKDKRPDTPALLIMDRISEDYNPPY